jgi:pilus assembly protein CpaB
MSARQIIVLVVAAIAAIGALLLIRGMGQNSAEPTVAAAPIAGEEILVAARDLPQGAALAPSDFKVVLFPTDAVSSSMMRSSAQTELSGAVTRRAFAQGEPLTQGSVLQPDGRGFLAAVLEPGFRAVAMPIDADTAAGGYIQPNDHVDVILTFTTEARGNAPASTSSEVIIQDVRVLALDDAVQTQTTGSAPERVQASVAVLELSAEEARLIALAEARGNLSLALRGVEVETVGMRDPSRRGSGAIGGGSPSEVRVHSFGTLTNGGGQ